MDDCIDGPKLKIKSLGKCAKNKDLCFNYLCKDFINTSMAFYLGTSIDLYNGEHRNIIEDVSNSLGKYGTVFRPDLAFSSTSAINHKNGYIVDINNMALNNCDIAVFAWNLNSVSVGLPIEMSMFDGKKILYCNNYEAISSSVYIKYYTDYIVDSIDNLEKVIKKIIKERS